MPWWSASAVHGDRQSGADLPHAPIGEPAESFHEHGHGDGLDRVEVHGGALRDRVCSRCESDLAGEPSDRRDRKSTRLNSSHVAISYAVFCLKKKNENTTNRCMCARA